MQTRCNRLVGVPVQTRSGQGVGKLADMSLDCDTGKIDVLIVKSRGFIPGLLDDEFRISWSQVVSIDPKVIVVVDGVEPIRGRRLAMGTSSGSTS